MNKEKLLQFVSNAIDAGAKIEIMMYSGMNTEESAKETAEEFAQIVDANVQESTSVDLTTRWFKVWGKHTISIFHENSDDKKHLKELAKKAAEEETA